MPTAADREVQVFLLTLMVIYLYPQVTSACHFSKSLVHHDINPVYINLDTEQFPPWGPPRAPRANVPYVEVEANSSAIPDPI
ncbi:uncharacterized protein EI90DRAFT_3074482, partial [Cantharellus anzutake]|uniref:uncharacterized protein n=1 Tax=Cantharellus anzutake TaxID=1750568 RepID=UPI001906E17C